MSIKPGKFRQTTFLTILSGIARNSSKSFGTDAEEGIFSNASHTRPSIMTQVHLAVISYRDTHKQE